MRKRAKKKSVQTCTLCQTIGHNKRRCGALARLGVGMNFEKAALVKKSSGVSVQKRNGRSIFVRTHGDRVSSPYLIDLRGEKKSHALFTHVRTFQEKTLAKADRATVDFAAMIRKSKERRHPDMRKIQINGYRFIMYPFIWIFRISGYIFSGIKFLFGRIRRMENIEFVPYRIAMARVHHNKVRMSIPGYAGPMIALSIILLILPIPTLGYYHKVKRDSARVIAASSDAFFSLQSSTAAALQSDLLTAEIDLNRALSFFSEAASILDREHTMLISVASVLPVIGKKIEARQQLLAAGHHVALANTYVLKGIGEASETLDMPFTNRLRVLQDHMRGAIPQYEHALVSLAHVEESALPIEHRPAFNEFTLLFATLIDDMRDLADLIDVLYSMFGGDEFRRYLVLFQNQHERRPSGGFLGSFAILDTQKGRIEHIDVPGGGTYDLQGQLSEYVQPPLPLRLVNGRWEFQDSNWFFDFGATAKKAEWFVTHSRGVTFDGVIALNASVLERLLTVVGPVSNAAHNLTITSETAISDLQYAVEIAYDKEENKPKQALADLLDQFLGMFETVDPAQLLALLAELHDALAQKEIQVFLHDAPIHQKMASFGWTGEVTKIQEAQDYLAVVGANLQGAKSDAKIKETISHHAAIADDGSATVTVTVERTHAGIPGELFYGASNISYVRAYVPYGSVLLGGEGFRYPPESAFHAPESWYADDTLLQTIETEEGYDIPTGTRITKEFGKTVFGNWMIVEPGETGRISFTYRLPFSLVKIKKVPEGNFQTIRGLFVDDPQAISHYQLVAQKQSGTNAIFRSEVSYPEGWSARWKTEDAVRLTPTGASVERIFEEDMTWGVVMEKGG